MVLICLDLDNTLIHSDKAHTTAYNYALSKLGYKKQNPDYISSLFGGPHFEIVKKLLTNSSKEDIDMFIKMHDAYLVKHTAKYAKQIRGAVSAVKKLKKNYELALVSNSHHKNVSALLKATKINPRLFDVIVGADQVKHAKPMPDEIFKAQKLSHHKAKLMVGDSIYDIIAGRKAKVKTIAVLTGNYSRKSLEKYKPYKIINSIRDLPGLIEKKKIII